MRTVFADAAYWIALLNPRDALHHAALRVSESLARTRIVTSELVLVEVLNTLARYSGLRSKVAQTVRAIGDDPNCEVVPLSGAQFRQALEFYTSRLDKDWGLTDCASFVIMRDRGIVEALTHDHDFVQAGFRALLRDSGAR